MIARVINYVKRTYCPDYQTLIVMGSVVFALAYGIIGSYLLRAQYHGVGTWIDALYFTFVTDSTIGYGDIYPLTTSAKLFTITMMLVGIGSFVAALSVLVGPIIQRHVKGVYNMVAHLHHLKQHVILCGVNELTKTLAKSLSSERDRCYFLETDPVLRAQLEREGFHVMEVDPGDEQQLAACNLPNAACFVVAYDDDAKNILVTMTAKALLEHKTSMKIITRVENACNISKARLAGATEVISPLIIGAERIVSLVNPI